MKLIGLTDFIDELRRTPTLCIGMAATSPRFDRDRVIRNLIDKHASGMADEYAENLSSGELLDLIRARSEGKYEKIFSDYKESLKDVKPTIELEKIAKVRWSACISITDDAVFEMAIRNHMDHVASSRTVTEISHAGIGVPERTLPIYKLLGQIYYVDEESALSITESGIVGRQQQWGSLLVSLPNYVKDGPVIFIGASEDVRHVRFLLAVLSQMGHPRPTRLVFLKGEAMLEDPTSEYILKKFNVQVVDASIAELTVAIEDARPKRLQRNLEFSSTRSLNDLISRFGELFHYVRKEETHVESLDKIRSELADVMFRPGSLDFRPFWEHMDIRRSITKEFTDIVLEDLNTSASGLRPPIIIRGEAGIGKTTFLKRLAVELSEKGVYVLWVKRGSHYGWPAKLREFVEILNKSLSGLDSVPMGLVFIADDPISLRVSSNELVSVISRIELPCSTLLSIRNSDFFISESEFDDELAESSKVIELPYKLDHEEIAQLSGLLLNIGAAKDAVHAQNVVNSFSNTDQADDILCRLWYLVPETHRQLSNSLQDEYLRLGSVDESIKGLAQNAADSSRVARTAYEIVTVTSNFGIGLPMEVLVQAVKVNYDEWIDMLQSGRPLWGLIYGEESESEDTVIYRTRNNVVTTVLLKLVNGGVGHMGEFRSLKLTIESCNSSSSIYRDFIVELLAGKRRELEKILSYEQGEELFKLALNRIGHDDKVLELQFGVWKHKKGPSLEDAYKQLEVALTKENYPNSAKKGNDTHIRTSQAAVIVAMVKEGAQDAETGLQLVRGLLREVSKTGVADTHASHVHANMLFDLADRHLVSVDQKLALVTKSDALKEIQQALQREGSIAHTHPIGFRRNVEALHSLRRKIIESVKDFSAMEELAENLYANHEDTEGFRVCFQFLFAQASESEKGKDYNKAFQYIQNVIKRVEADTQSVPIELLGDRADVDVRWRLHGMKTGIDWTRLRSDLKAMLESPYYSEDVMRQFYYAVASYHCGDRSEANAVFAGIRRKNLDYSAKPWILRCAYLGKNGAPKRFQGNVKGGYGSEYVVINELEDSIRVSRDYPVGSVGSTVHVYIGFSLKGPLAMKDRPDQQRFQLP
ncbi:MAG: hypothetical protein ABW130_19265 [Candidatus Thiodiazotropha lotti]